MMGTNTNPFQHVDSHDSSNDNIDNHNNKDVTANSSSSKSSSSSSSCCWSIFSLRELRHNAYIMSPLSLLLLLGMGLISGISFVLQLPSLLLSYLILTPLLQRSAWLVEFLYPLGIAGWCHVSMIQWWMQRYMYRHATSNNNSNTSNSNSNNTSNNNNSNDKNRGCHSRTMEQRIEVVMGRVYIHPIAQLLDNVAYLVVCLPPSSNNNNNNKNNKSMSRNDDNDPLQEEEEEEVSVEVAAVPASTLKQNKTGLGTISIIHQSLPRPPSNNINNNNNNYNTKTIVAFVVDCGDAPSLLEQVEWIRDLHYPGQDIQIQSILSTHKHHDHTAGNKNLISQLQSAAAAAADVVLVDDIHRTVKPITVYGGAVERIPYCNHPVVNGDKLVLPSCGNNDMNDVVEVEVLAVPAHTRGSVTYALRPKNNAAAYLFTGDTIFSGGSGVPFEADIDTAPEHKRTTDRTGRSMIKAGSGSNAVERCFAEILARGLTLVPPSTSTTTTSHNNNTYQNNSNTTTTSSSSLVMGDNVSNHIFIFPGHEYTAELLQRQLLQTLGDSCKWKLFAPSVFFETVSQLYVALHRRSLPHNSGKLLAIPSPLRREMKINPHYRLLALRGEHVVRAIRLWYKHFQQRPHVEVQIQQQHVQQQQQQQQKVQIPSSKGDGLENKKNVLVKTPSLPDRWNLNADDLRQPVFTTLYTSDLDQLIHDLGSGLVDAKTAAQRLDTMKSVLDHPVVGRRPIPGSLPPDKVIYKGVLGLILLGSPPCAFTFSDSRAMNIPPPMDRDSDKIQISMRRLITVLGGLGLFEAYTFAEDGNHQNHQHRDDQSPHVMIHMIQALWKEAIELSTTATTTTSQQQQLPDRLNASATTNYNATTDLEHSLELPSPLSSSSSSSAPNDLVDLGVLKWLLYGVSGMTPSWLGKYCLPCSSSKGGGGGTAKGKKAANFTTTTWNGLTHPIQTSKMKQKHGELVRHDVLTCPLCRSAAGFPDVVDIHNYMLRQHQQHLLQQPIQATAAAAAQTAAAPVATAAAAAAVEMSASLPSFSSASTNSGGGGGGGGRSKKSKQQQSNNRRFNKKNASSSSSSSSGRNVDHNNANDVDDLLLREISQCINSQNNDNNNDTIPPVVLRYSSLSRDTTTEDEDGGESVEMEATPGPLFI